MTANETPQLLTVKEVAVVLRVSRTIVYELFKSGGLPSVKIRARRLVRVDDLNTFIEAATAGLDRAAG